MDDQLEIRTLGGLTILRSGTAVTDFDQRKVPALLVYLVCNPRPQPREVLAELFWEDRTQSQSSANLRVALSNLRKTVGPFVDVTRETAGMTTDDWWLDAVAFEEWLEQAGQNPEQLEEALDLYQGDFLAGFYIDSQVFEDWALLERERLRLLAVDAFDRLIDLHLAHQNYTNGIRQATRLLRLDGQRERTYAQLMRLFALSGERTTALSYYDTCRQMLETEFGVQPSAETEALFKDIQAGHLKPETTAPRIEPESLPQPSWKRPRHNLPVQPTSFVGRVFEITTAMEQLKNCDCRLLTLVGPGGIGKTRLALEVAEHLVDTFANGVFFVPLTTLSTPEGIAPTISGELGLTLSSRHVEPEQELLNYLRDKELLLVLDNFEHLLIGADLVSRILSAAPGVTVLATSREPLELGWECLYEVRGLGYPTDADSGQVEDYSGLKLFVERAHRAQPEFRLAPVRASVVRICQLVDGLPLGIEIAAAWVRVLPCETIADELLTLELPRRDVPARHQSLRTLFAYTWQQLTPAEQHVFKGLSVFRGSFTLEAAKTVTGASWARLVALVNKSLLQSDHENHRYSIHELLRQYAAELLATDADDEQRAYQRHSEYYCAFLAEQFGPITNGIYQAVIDDLDNVLAAWDWAVSTSNLQLISQGMHTLYWFFWSQYVPQAIGKQAFRRRGHTLAQQLSPNPERDAVVGQLLAIESDFSREQDGRRALAAESLAHVNASGDLNAQAFAENVARRGFPVDEWAIHLRRSIELYTQVNDEWGVAISTLGLGKHLGLDQMRPAEGLVAAERALQLFRELENPFGVMRTLMTVGAILKAQGELDRARRCFQEALKITDQYNPPHLPTKSEILNQLAYLNAVFGLNLAEAEEQAQQAVAIRRAMGTPGHLRYLIDTLATVKYARGDHAGAAALFQECLEISHSMAHATPQQFADTQGKLGLVAQATGRLQAAYRHLATALQLGVGHNLEADIIVRTMVIVALSFARDGRQARALDILGFTIPRPAHDKLIFEESRLRAALEAEFGTDAVEAAIERGKNIDPLDLAREVLAELEQA